MSGLHVLEFSVYAQVDSISKHVEILLLPLHLSIICIIILFVFFVCLFYPEVRVLALTFILFYR